MDSPCYNMGMNGGSVVCNNRKVLNFRDMMVGHMLDINKMILSTKCDKNWLSESVFLRQFTVI